MRIAAHHKGLGDGVVFQKAGNFRALDVGLFDSFDKVYASLIFSRTRPLAEYLLAVYPDAITGGTGWNVKLTLEDIGITTQELDYSIYPRYPHSIGYTQTGCRLRCAFCCVPEKEGRVREKNAIAQIWREGQTYQDAKNIARPCPGNILLLDNDFFGQPNWQARIDELRQGNFKVCFNQGINARMLTDETAAALVSVKCSDDQFKERRIYTAWDNRGDESRLFQGLNCLKSHGVNPDDMMVYMLIGYWPGETAGDREYRRAKLRQFGCRPYPMPFFTDAEWREIFWKRTTPRIRELDGFKRWVLGTYDKRGIAWEDWVAARYQPKNLGRTSFTEDLFSEEVVSE